MKKPNINSILKNSLENEHILIKGYKLTANKEVSLKITNIMKGFERVMPINGRIKYRQNFDVNFLWDNSKSPKITILTIYEKKDSKVKEGLDKNNISCTIFVFINNFLLGKYNPSKNTKIELFVKEYKDYSVLDIFEIIKLLSSNLNI